MIGSRYEKNKILSFDERVDPATAALVVIDIQNDFALPDGVCGKVGDDISPVAPMLARLSALIDTARKAGVLIIFVRTIYDEPVLSPSLAEQYLRRGYLNSICLSGTPCAEFYGDIGPRNAPNEILVTKHRYSAFWGSSIDLVLRTNVIRTVVLTGLATEVCVESTARDAFFKDYQVVMPEDCMGSYAESRQKAALTVVARSFGVVTNAEEVETVWRRLGNGPRNWQPEMMEKRALRTIEAQLAPVHTAVLLINVETKIYKSGAHTALESTLPAARNLLDKARQARCLVVHAHGASISARGHDMSQPIPGFEPRGDEQTIFCHRTSAFADTALDVLLRSNCIRTVVVAGATTNCAVEATVREATDKDYISIVAKDCVAATDAEADLHKASLTNIGLHFGTVLPSQDIVAHWPPRQ